MFESHAFLTKPEIQQKLKDRDIIVEPLLDENVQIDQASIDLRLDNWFGKFTIAEEPLLDVKEETSGIEFFQKEFFKDHLILHPGKFVLGQTFEYIALPDNIIGTLDGRSSLGRRGIIVHATASYVDPGWKGHLVFEFANVGEMPVKLYPLMRIARLTLFHIDKVEEYSGKYKCQIRIKKPKPDDELVTLLRKVQPKT